MSERLLMQIKPRGAITRFLGRLLGSIYARWYVKSMIGEARTRFTERSLAEHRGTPI